MSEENNNTHGNYEGEEHIHDVQAVSGMYEEWFLEYASYVILERAVPTIEDGLKPVQRRIMHAMKEMDDGRYNKVANIIGQTMQYHPHGDASIGDAMVSLGQKNLLIDTQGNWGDIRTGDGAAAPRYIEARLSKFASDVLFNPKTTEWQLSYDGRKREPVTLPVKFPLLLAQGVEGIAVGLSTKVLPHNFCELIKAAIDVLKDKDVTLYPDFPTGGMADFSDYNEGKRGGRVKVRARIEEYDKKTLVIKDIPFGTTTTSLIDSIIKANDKGKIKVKKVVDNTAEHVEILVSLAPNQSPDMTIDALYAFTDCEVSISPNACVIRDEKPDFTTVSEMLQHSVAQTKDLLRRELEIRKGELMEKLLFSSLEKIFIENRLYRDIEECETWESVLETIDKGLDPYKKDFYREIEEEDLVRLTEIKIKRISKYDTFKADELMRKLQDELAEVEHNLAHIVDYAIAYYKNLLEKHGKGRERKTEIRTFDQIAATVVAANNAKLYVNSTEGFIGYGMKRDENAEVVSDCSDIDDIIVFRKDGKYVITKIQEKVFVGKGIIHADVYRKNDERKVYNAMYLDGKSGRTMAKRFQVLSMTRDREYDITKGNKGSKLLHFTPNYNGEAEKVTVKLTQSCTARNKVFEYDFAELDIKGKTAAGNLVTKYPVKQVKFKEAGPSTLGGLDIWFDETVGRLNTDKRGRKLGTFHTEDTILAVYKDGSYEMTNYELTNRYDPKEVVLVRKFDPKMVLSAIYYDGASKQHYIKRFLVETTTMNKRFTFISDARASRLEVVSADEQPQVEIAYTPEGSRKKEKAVYDMDLLIEVRGWKAVGNKLPQAKVKDVKLLESEEKPQAKEKTEEQKEQLGMF